MIKIIILCGFSFVLGMIIGAVIAFQAVDDEEVMTEDDKVDTGWYDEIWYEGED